MKKKNKNNNYGDYNLSIIEHIDENMNVEYIKSSAIKNCINAWYYILAYIIDYVYRH